MANRFDPETHTYYINEIEVPHITGLMPEQEKHVSDQQYEDARKKGDDNHSLIKMYFDTGEIFNEPMLLALDTVIKDKAREFGGIKLYEKPLFSRKYMFGGTPDILFPNAIIDFKLYFGNKLYHALQLAGQYLLAKENGICDTLNWYIGFYKDAKLRLKPVYNIDAVNMFLKLIDKYYIDQSINKYLKGEVDG